MTDSNAIGSLGDSTRFSQGRTFAPDHKDHWVGKIHSVRRRPCFPCFPASHQTDLNRTV
ncbi:hypothetical protein XMIN_2154 [Xanthomonas citri pv. mangiferaeindicae LMG 941]|nr:hypothetical protein XMIN_2154 [Xanthomonas citri pv. mangiferaeindicae LMG 941]